MLSIPHSPFPTPALPIICPMPRLIVRATPARGDSVVDLNRPRITIGRSARNDLCVEDPFASRLHAEVRKRGDAFWIADLGSANGTMVNTARLTAPVQLRDLDVIRIGETEIEYPERVSAFTYLSVQPRSDDCRGRSQLGGQSALIAGG